MSDQARHILADLLSACFLFATGAAVGMGMLVALFKLGVASSMDILFYRGIVLCGIAFVLTVGLLVYLGRVTGRASMRDAIAAGCLSLGINLSVLVIAPVTIDRSVSIFILGHMAAHEGRTFTADEIEAALQQTYFGELRQVERRMREQLRSGTIARTAEGYTISPQGLAFVKLARRVGALFDVDPRLLLSHPTDHPAPPPSDLRRAPQQSMVR
jgi:hypothetical protein